MYPSNSAAPNTERFACTLEPETSGCLSEGNRWRLRRAGVTLTVWNWMPLPVAATNEVVKGRAVTLAIERHDIEHLLLSFERNDLTPLGELVGEHMCPVRGVVEQTTALVDGLQHLALRRFVSDALLLPVARDYFWRVPASRTHHHTYQGGLAKHSLEIATMLATSSGLMDDDRELGIAFALLHDYGKVHYAQQARGIRMSCHHEEIGLQLLTPLLAQLIATAPDLGLKMQELLGGPRAPRSSPYPLAIGKVVRAFDQMSCEASRRLCEFF